MVDRGAGVEPNSHAVLYAWIVAFELSLGVGAVVTWVALDLVELRLALALTAARSLLWFVHMHRLLAPVEAVATARERSSDAQLFAADAAIQRLHHVTPYVYAASWTGLELIWVGLGVLGVGVEYGEPELYTGSMFALCLVSIAVLVFLVIERCLARTCDVIGDLLLARRLRPARAPMTISTPMARGSTLMAVGIFASVGGAAIAWMGSAVRDQAEARLQLEVELSLVALAHGEAIREDARIVAADSLEPGIRAAFAEGVDPDAAEMLVVHDRGDGRMIAAAPIGGERWITSELAPDGPLRAFSLFVGLTALFLVPIYGLAFRAVARAISAPLSTFAGAAQTFVERGELEPLEQLSSLRNDEIGRLAVGFNAMLDILIELSQTADTIAAGDLRIELTHPGPLHDAFRAMLAALNAIVANLRETALELASSATELRALTERQEQAAQTQSTNLQKLTQNLGSLAIAAQEVNVATEGVREDADRAVATTDASAAAIAELREQSTSIAELLARIEEIAQRSDLLALNGSLEATRAGEAGRGFALVAAEMRRLSERIVGTVEDVRTRVLGIEAVGDRTVRATEHSRAIARRTAEAATRISTLVATQSGQTEQASRGLVATSVEVENAAAAMTQLRASAGRLGELAGELERSITRFELR